MHDARRCHEHEQRTGGPAGRAEGKEQDVKLDIYYRLYGTTKDDVKFERVQPPQRIKGRWTEKTVTENPQACGIREWQSAKCSVCGKYHSTPYLYSFTEYAFCPHCGADMRGEDDAFD